MDVDDRLESSFNAAADWVAGAVSSGQAGFTDALKLSFYGLYKQATAGKCTASQPAFWNRAARLKWDAWNKLGSMDQETAMAQYVALLSSSAPSWSGGEPSGSGGGEGEGSDRGGGGGGGGGFGPVFSTFAVEEEEEEEGQEGPSLHALAGKGDQEGLLALLDQGLAVDTRDDEGCTPLHFAADRGQLAVASILLARGADVNAVDEDGASALHYAALCGNEQAAVLLLASGADWRLLDSSGQTAREVGPSTWQCWQDLQL